MGSARKRCQEQRRVGLLLASRVGWGLSAPGAGEASIPEELLAERGVVLTDETIRPWCRKFGRIYAAALRRRRPCPGDT